MPRPYPKSRWTPAWSALHPQAYHEGEPLHIGTRTQLLAHGAVVEDRRGVVRRIVRPERHPEPVVVAEHPWETRRTFYPQVLADKQTGRLRMWYGTLPAVPPGEPTPPYSLLYAESDDGLRWEKPLFDLCAAGEHRRTNILYRGQYGNCSAFAIVRDDHEPDPSRRYKMVHKEGKRPDGVFTEALALSPDGIHWRPYENNPVMPQRHDTNLNLLYDTARQRWLAFARPYAFSSGLWPSPRVGHHRRRVALTYSPDLIHWSKLRTVLGPEEGDGNEFDNIAVFPYGDVLIGFLGIFEEDPSDPHGQRMHIELAFSSDGCRWERLPGRPLFLSPTGRAGDFDSDTVYPATAGLIDDPGEGVPAERVHFGAEGDSGGGWAPRGEIVLYYNGASWLDGDPGDCDSAIGLLRLPADRFVEQYADETGGWLLTREFLLEGDRLQLNMRARGSVTVELAEYPGQALPGFSLADCDPITGDYPARIVTWRGGNADLSALRGRPLYARFHLKEAGLFSFTVRDATQEREAG
jgi:hypothetical protein